MLGRPGSRRVVAGSLLVGLPGAAVIGAAAPSLAGGAHSFVHHDHSGDVIAYTASGSVKSKTSDGDITKVSATYGTRELQISMWFAKLDKPTGKTTEEHDFLVHYGKDKGRRLAVVANAAHPHGTAKFYTISGSKLTCKTSWTIDYAKNLATATIPASCVAKTASLRVDTSEYQVRGGHQYVDDGFNNDASVESGKYSSVIYR